MRVSPLGPSKLVQCRAMEVHQCWDIPHETASLRSVLSCSQLTVQGSGTGSIDRVPVNSMDSNWFRNQPSIGIQLNVDSTLLEQIKIGKVSTQIQVQALSIRLVISVPDPLGHCTAGLSPVVS